MKNLTTKCVILGHKNIRENDKLIFIYTEKLGKLKAVAKGSRKLTSKFTGHLETLNICTVELYFGPKNTLITEIGSGKNLLKNVKDLKTIEAALKIAEITNKVIFEEQTVENIIPLITETLKKITENHEKIELIKNAYIIQLLDKIGYIPDFKENLFNLKEKYVKFFNYLRTRPINEINRIKLKSEEEKYIEKITEQLLAID